MGFDQFGMKNFVSETKTQEFVKYLEQGKMMTTQCKKCRKITFPPKMDCVICQMSDMEWIEVKEDGKLITFTEVMYGPAGFEKDTPYTLALVEFPMGIKIFGQMDKKIPPNTIRIGMELKVIPITLPNGRYSYRFEKV